MIDKVPDLIEGGVFVDERGQLEFVNDFDATQIKRFYISSNNSIDFFRGWQGHKIEQRWFFCIQGAFEVKLIKIDDWKKPSELLKIEKFELRENKPEILFIPNGYVNGFQATIKNSKMLVFSDYLMGEIENDEVRYQPNKWK